MPDKVGLLTKNRGKVSETLFAIRRYGNRGFADRQKNAAKACQYNHSREICAIYRPPFVAHGPFERILYEMGGKLMSNWLKESKSAEKSNKDARPEEHPTVFKVDLATVFILNV